MKKVFFTSICILALVLIASFGFAQMGGGMTGEQKGEMKQQGMMDEGMMKQMMPMMEMCMPMMKQMMGEGMMMQDLMRAMQDVLRMQKKVMRGMSPVEKKEMAVDIDRMMDRMEKMMSDMREMMMKGMMGPAPMTPGKVEQKKEVPAKEGAPEGHQHKH